MSPRTAPVTRIASAPPAASTVTAALTTGTADALADLSAGTAAVSRAGRTARSLAARGGVEFRAVTTPAEASAAVRLLCDVWRTSEIDAPVSPDLMLALAHSGGYVAGAYAGEVLLGASVGFLAEHATLHSHISGVAAAARGRSVGHALKLHQRAWALERGLGCITWTFDPLVRRNAWFNLAKLAARGEQYLPDFYGSMRDGINAGDQSDRLFAVWDLTTERASAAAEGVWLPADEDVLRAGGATLVLDQDRNGRPVRLRVGSGAGRLLARVPEDIERLRLQDPAAARSWRSALRDALLDRLADGWSATGFTRAGCYVLGPPV